MITALSSRVVTASGGELNNVTISNNQASGRGGGIDGRDGLYTLRNTILANNSSTGVGPDCSGSIISSGYNLIGKTNGCTINQQKNTDQVGLDPRLKTLDLNGGSTMIAVPRLNSPAVDNGACDLSADQQGISRPVDGDLDKDDRCDIGAAEFVPIQVRMPLVRR